MLLWLLFAVLTAVMLAVVLAPLGRPAREATAPDPVTEAVAESGTLAVYRHQLDEIEAERARGLVNDAEAAAARSEISRRLLAIAAVAEDGTRTSRASLPAQRVTVAMAVAAPEPV